MLSFVLGEVCSGVESSVLMNAALAALVPPWCRLGAALV